MIFSNNDFCCYDAFHNALIFDDRTVDAEMRQGAYGTPLVRQKDKKDQ